MDSPTWPLPGKTPNDVLDALCDERVIVYPLDLAIVALSQTMTAIREMHDRLIVATVLALKNSEETPPLITRDENIVASGLVPTIW